MKKIIITLFALACIVSACKKNDGQVQLADSDANDVNSLRILAGSELKDIEPLLEQIKKNTGVQIKLSYAGTLEAVERLQSGESYDAAWIANNHYAMLVPEVKSRVVASERTMITPVVLGIKESKAKELGWIGNSNLTWKDIADAATNGKFTFGMTSPVSSNTGFSGLLGLAAALSGKGDALEEKDINTKSLASFFKAQRLTAGSSGWLADAYIKDQTKVDGIINYASVLLSMNKKPELKEKLTLIYPKDGIVTADYPIMLVNQAKRDAFNKVAVYIRGKEFQQAMVTTTLRRSVNPEVQSAEQAAQTLVELNFPAKIAVIDAILAAFDNSLRLPTDASFVLDTSGSMNGTRIDDLRNAMLGLTGADKSISGRFTRFHNRERISLIPFSDAPKTSMHFDMGDDDATNQATLKQISSQISELNADGGTAIYDSIKQAYLEASARRKTDNNRFYSIVLLTDGVNTSGSRISDFIDWYNRLPNSDKGIKIFPVVFGEADSSELHQIAEISGGRSFDSRKNTLSSIFKEIRGYQ